MTRIGTLVTKSLTVLDSTDENRFFEGYLTVEMKDKQGEITVVDELYKVLPIWVDRGAPITDTHSNRVIGKGINFAKTTVTDGGVTYPAIKITGKIHKNYELDTDIWEKIKSGEYKGLSFGGATKANRVPKVMKDGDIAYALTDLEHYEVAVCRDPAVPLALITDYNTLAKATVPSEPRGDGKEVIKCDKFGCYVTQSEGKDEPEYHDESNLNKEPTDKDEKFFKEQKIGETVTYPNSKTPYDKKRTWYKVGGVEKGGEDWSNADIIPATVTNTVSQSTQTAKPIKTDKKVGVPEREGGLKMNVTPLEGGIKPPTETKKEFPAGVGGGVRAHIDDASNQDNPKDQTAQVSEKIERIHKANVNKVIGAILAGAQRVKSLESIVSKDSVDGKGSNKPKPEPTQGEKIMDKKIRDEHTGYDPKRLGEFPEHQPFHDRKVEEWDERQRGMFDQGDYQTSESKDREHWADRGVKSDVKPDYADWLYEKAPEKHGLKKPSKDPTRKSWEMWLENKSLGALGWGKLNRDGSKQKLRKKQPKLDDFTEEKKKFGHTTEEGNIQLGNPSIPKELKEKLISSLGAQNKENIATTDTKRVDKSNYCPSCGQKKTEGMKRDYPETNRPHSDCTTCDQNKRIAERDKKGKQDMDKITEGVKRNLGSRGIKVQQFS